MEAQVLGLVHELTGPQGVSLDTPLMDAGVDSLAAGLLAARLTRLDARPPEARGVGAPLVPLAPLSHLLVFEAPTPRAIAARMLERAAIAHGAIAPLPAPSAPPPAPPLPPATAVGVTLVCAAGRFGGGG